MGTTGTTRSSSKGSRGKTQVLFSSLTQPTITYTLTSQLIQPKNHFKSSIVLLIKIATSIMAGSTVEGICLQGRREESSLTKRAVTQSAKTSSKCIKSRTTSMEMEEWTLRGAT